MATNQVANERITWNHDPEETLNPDSLEIYNSLPEEAKPFYCHAGHIVLAHSGDLVEFYLKNGVLKSTYWTTKDDTDKTPVLPRGHDQFVLGVMIYGYKYHMSGDDKSDIGDIDQATMEHLRPLLPREVRNATTEEFFANTYYTIKNIKEYISYLRTDKKEQLVGHSVHPTLKALLLEYVPTWHGKGDDLSIDPVIRRYEVEHQIADSLFRNFYHWAQVSSTKTYQELHDAIKLDNEKCP